MNSDVRVTHADPADLTKPDLELRQEVVGLLRALPHELDRESLRRAAMVRASFVNAGDYVSLLGTHSKQAWVLGRIRRVDGLFSLVESGDRERTFLILGSALEILRDVRSELWLGRVATDRAAFPVGPVDLLEPVGQ